MGNYIYKCVSLALESYNEEGFLVNTVNSYEKILNDTAKDGWDFVKVDTISFVPSKSNLNLKQSAVTENTITKILIFRKQMIETNENQTEINFIFNESKVICPACKNEVSADDIYCENCAYKLK